MPVRIYDISKKLGLENKEVLSKAKELGIAAKVASSSLDKITAEYLEQELLKAHPGLLAAPPAAPPVAPPQLEEPVVIVSAPSVEEAPPPPPPGPRNIRRRLKSPTGHPPAERRPVNRAPEEL